MRVVLGRFVRRYDRVGSWPWIVVCFVLLTFVMVRVLRMLSIYSSVLYSFVMLSCVLFVW